MLLSTALNPLRWFSTKSSGSQLKAESSEKKHEVSLEEKKLLHKVIDSPTLTWNDRLKLLTGGLINFGGAFLNLVPGYRSIVVSRMRHLLLRYDKEEPFKPEKLETKCKKYQIDPKQVKETFVKSKKFFIEPNLPSDRQKQLVNLFHGARTTGNIFGKLVDDLVSKGHPISTGDMMGFGDNSNYSLDSQNLTGDVVGLIEESRFLRPGQHISIVGHSLGTAMIIAALKEIFEKEAHQGPLTKIDKVVLISSWDNLENVVRDLLAEDPKLKGQTKLHAIIDSHLGADQKHIEDMILEKLQAKDSKNSIDDLGPELNIYNNLKALLELNSKRPEEFKIRSFEFIHGKKDIYVNYKRSQELHNLVKDSGTPSHYSLLEDGDHFDRKIKGQNSLPSELITNVLSMNPAPRNTISAQEEQVIDSLSREELLEGLKLNKIKPRQIQARLDDLRAKARTRNLAVVA